MLGVLIKSGVGLTGLLLALVGYGSGLAIFGGAAVATLAWTVLNFREGKLGEETPESAFRTDPVDSRADCANMTREA